MKISEQHVRLAAKLYEMRDSAKQIAGDRYDGRIEDWKKSLSIIAEKLGVDPLRAVPMICRANPVSDFDVMWLTAAAVELAEPASQAREGM